MDAPAFIRASVSTPPRGGPHASAEVEAAFDTVHEAAVTVHAVSAGGTERLLSSWTGAARDYDRILLSRSPDNARVAVALGRELITLNVADGAVVARAPIPHSEQAIVFGWDPEGAVVVRDTEAPGGPDLPLGDGWVLPGTVDIDQDDGFSGGHTTAIPLGESDPDDRSETLVVPPLEAIAVSLAKDGRALEVRAPVDRPVTATMLQWPPIVGRSGLLLRHSGGVGYASFSMAPLIVAPDGTATAIPVDLGVSPVCALPDGRFMLPGASELWRDGGDEPIHALSADGAVEPVLFGGVSLKASQIIAVVAPDLLPAELPADPAWPAWGLNDEGYWVHAARVAPDGGSVTILLGENTWIGDDYDEDACGWLVARLPLGPTGEPELIARGERAIGERMAIAL